MSQDIEMIPVDERPDSPVERVSLRQELETVINCHCAEGASDTPDFILAEYLMDCLAAFDKAVNARESWYGRCVATQKGSPSVSLD